MQLEAQLIEDEGFRKFPYLCPAGKLTIGYGFNIEAGIEENEARALLQCRISNINTRLAALLPWFKYISDRRKDAFVNMAYQMGISGLLRFRKMLKAAEKGDWESAYIEALDSSWAKQTPHRAHRVARQIKERD